MKILSKIFLAVAFVTVVGLGCHVNADSAVSQSQPTIAANGLDCPNCDGGKLSYNYKCFAVQVECTLCHGKGTVGTGEYKSKCTLCQGSGKTTEYKGGYQCNNCNYRSETL
ncbi:MAG: hypothetical protein LIP02_14980 [Bacteroidales bacterium]|nr:hypothetical protein [Bacteroidales bacterium]